MSTYLAVEDYIPAGAEILDASLKTSQVGEGERAAERGALRPAPSLCAGLGLVAVQRDADLRRPHRLDGRLPARRHLRTDLLRSCSCSRASSSALPARAWQLYFPEVQANSAGAVFEIKP